MYALRATLTPVITMFGMDVGALLGGAILTDRGFRPFWHVSGTTARSLGRGHQLTDRSKTSNAARRALTGSYGSLLASSAR